MDNLKLLLELPLGTLALLAGGYIGYRTAYVGRNRSHSAIDTLFYTLAFGLIVRLSYGITDKAMAPGAQALWGVTAAFVAAAIWRVWLSEAWFQLTRRIGLNDHDGHSSAWHSLLARGRITKRSLIIYLKDGTCLMSHEALRFQSAPLGPFLLGEDGSVSLYVTDICSKDDKAWRSLEDGQLPGMTFIPAAEIARTEIFWL